MKLYKVLYCALGNDYAIIEDIPEVQLQRNTDTYFECPNCGAHREVIVYSEDIVNNENIRECFKCGKKVKIINLGEFNKNASQDTISKYKTWLQHMIKISDQDLLTYSGELNFVKAMEYEIRRGVFEECLDSLNKMEGDSKIESDSKSKNTTNVEFILRCRICHTEINYTKEQMKDAWLDDDLLCPSCGSNKLNWDRHPEELGHFYPIWRLEEYLGIR